MKLTKQRKEFIAEACNMVRENLTNYNAVFTDPSRVKDFATLALGTRESEGFMVMFLDSQHKLIADEIMFEGTIDGAAVYPREVVKRALSHNAAAVILAHNHPSGKAEPSQADAHITKRLVDALSMVDIRTLDHILVGESTMSFAERGLI